jgi:hypothetical protein
MECLICAITCEGKFCLKHKKMLDSGWIVSGWEKVGEGYIYKSRKALDILDKRLNKAIQEGRAAGKSINKLRSYKNKTGWNYKYI